MPQSMVSDKEREGEREEGETVRERDRCCTLIIGTFYLFVNLFSYLSDAFYLDASTNRALGLCVSGSLSLYPPFSLATMTLDLPLFERCKTDGTNRDAWCPVRAPYARSMSSPHRRPPAQHPS